MNKEEILKANAILDAREERVNLIETLIENYKDTIVVARVNYPGNNKENYISDYIIEKGREELIKVFNDRIEHIIEKSSAEGPYIVLILKLDGNTAKRRTIEIENTHLLGRFLDLDVYEGSISSISRQSLGFDKRTCYLCGNYAHECIRSKNHTVEEVEEFIIKAVKRYMEK